MVSTVAQHDEVRSLLHRVRGEYAEMPGLQLSAAQARRLWHMNEGQCAMVLELLVESGFLRQTPYGTYVRLSPEPSRVRPRADAQGLDRVVSVA